MFTALPFESSLCSTNFKLKWYLADLLGMVIDLETRAKNRISKLIARMLGVVFTSVVDESMNFSKVIDFIIQPKGVVIENYWTNYPAGTSASVTVPCVTEDIPNTYLIAVMQTTSNTAFSSAKFNGVSATTWTEVHNTGKSCAMACFLNPAIGTYNFTATAAAAVAWTAVVYQLSGVNQTTPYTDLQSGSQIHTVTLATVAYGITIDVDVDSNTVIPASGQTMITVNSVPTSGYLLTPNYPNQIISYTSSGSYYGLVAIALNPA